MRLNVPSPATACAAALLAALAGPLAAQPAAATSARGGSAWMAHLLLTPDEAALRRAWAEAAAGGAQPRLEATDTATPGRTVSAVVIFSGCAPGPAGACDVTVDYALQGDDGVRRPAGGGPLWTEAPHTPRFMLGGTSLLLGFAERDRGARLQVRATVTDRVAQRRLELAAPLRVD